MFEKSNLYFHLYLFSIIKFQQLKLLHIWKYQLAIGDKAIKLKDLERKQSCMFLIHNQNRVNALYLKILKETKKES